MSSPNTPPASQDQTPSLRDRLNAMGYCRLPHPDRQRIGHLPRSQRRRARLLGRMQIALACWGPLRFQHELLNVAALATAEEEGVVLFRQSGWLGRHFVASVMLVFWAVLPLWYSHAELAAVAFRSAGHPDIADHYQRLHVARRAVLEAR